MKKLCLSKYLWAWLSVLLHLIFAFCSHRYLVRWKPHRHMTKYRKDNLRALKRNLPSVIWQDVRCCFLKLLNIKRTPHFQFLCYVCACVCLLKTVFHCIYLTAWKLQLNGENYKSSGVKTKLIRWNKLCLVCCAWQHSWSIMWFFICLWGPVCIKEHFEQPSAPNMTKARNH